jgi:hypothetical protein
MKVQGTTAACAGCGETFALEFDDDSEEWMFKAVDSKAGPMHAHCFREAELVSVATRLAMYWLLKPCANKRMGGAGLFDLKRAARKMHLFIVVGDDGCVVCACRAARYSRPPAQLARKPHFHRLLLMDNQKPNASRLCNHSY